MLVSEPSIPKTMFQIPVMQGPPEGDVGMLLSHARISVVPDSQSFTFSPELLHYLEKEEQMLSYIFFEPSGTRKHIFTVSKVSVAGISDCHLLLGRIFRCCVLSLLWGGF